MKLKKKSPLFAIASKTVLIAYLLISNLSFICSVFFWKNSGRVFGAIKLLKMNISSTITDWVSAAERQTLSTGLREEGHQDAMRAALRAQSDHVTPEQQEGGQKRLLELKGSHLQLLDDSSRWRLCCCCCWSKGTCRRSSEDSIGEGAGLELEQDNSSSSSSSAAAGSSREWQQQQQQIEETKQAGGGRRWACCWDAWRRAVRTWSERRRRRRWIRSPRDEYFLLPLTIDNVHRNANSVCFLMVMV